MGGSAVMGGAIVMGTAAEVTMRWWDSLVVAAMNNVRMKRQRRRIVCVRPTVQLQCTQAKLLLPNSAAAVGRRPCANEEWVWAWAWQVPLGQGW